MQIVILGCGKVGSLLAQLLADRGEDVVIIDEDPRAFDRLGSGFNGRTVLGKGIDLDVLKAAGVETADYLISVTTNDNVNIMASQIAEEIFHVPEALCRVHDTEREAIFRDLGLETISPTRLTALQILRRIETGASLAEGLPAGFEWMDVKASGSWTGKRVAEVERLFGIRVVFIHRQLRPIMVTADTLIEEDDLLALVTPSANPHLKEATSR